MEKVLIAGATGTTGNKVVNLLKESQYFEPVAMIRKEEQKATFDAQNVKWRMGDLTESLEDLTQGIDRVIFAAGSKGENLEEVDKNGAIKLIDDANKHKVKKFVMLSSMGAGNPEEAEDLKDYLKAKKAADDHLQQTQLNYAIVRPGALTNDEGNHHIHLEHQISKQGEIARADVAQTLVSVLHEDTANKQTFEIINGDTLIGKALDELSTVHA